MWGVTDKVTPSGGFWNNEEITHVNISELKGGLLRQYFMALKFTVKIRFSNMSRLCVITQQQSLTLVAWDAKSLKIVIHWQRKPGNGV